MMNLKQIHFPLVLLLAVLLFVFFFCFFKKKKFSTIQNFNFISLIKIEIFFEKFYYHLQYNLEKHLIQFQTKLNNINEENKKVKN